MSTTAILIVVAVVVVVVIAFVALRKKEPEALPPERDQVPAARPPAQTEPAKAAPKAASKAEAKPEAKPEPKPEAAKPEASAASEAEPEAKAADAKPTREETQEIRPEQIEEQIEDAEADAEAEPPPPPPRASAPTPPVDVAAYKAGLTRTRGGFLSRLAKLFTKKTELDPAVFEEMEEILLTADIGVSTAEKLLSTLREAVDAGDVKDGEAAWGFLRGQVAALLRAPGSGPFVTSKKPTVVLVVGVNGVGKTTTIGKLASAYRDEGKRVLLAAGDTFRAAAVLQLDVWGKRAGADVVKGKDRADPSAVIFDAVKRGIESGVDVIICDTAGRLHTKTPLMQELEKVGRSVEKALGRAADEVLLVLDSTTGQNAIQQAQIFKEALPVSGIALTKLDGSAKGGVILGIVDQHQVPVRFIGLGERVEDLKPFDVDGFVEALFARDANEEAAADEG
ncbi:MAG: signal recognition particle-docking protein FtsY [Sandaracinus sp.]|nr:signal recognition particle-docking protein FtsY [Sandaracinus sp.]MCB9632232.1 signal recognition particle-docking protein FtsY [Sandaracinus sp.]